jgi:hypothetical protein
MYQAAVWHLNKRVVVKDKSGGQGKRNNMVQLQVQLLYISCGMDGVSPNCYMGKCVVPHVHGPPVPALALAEAPASAGAPELGPGPASGHLACFTLIRFDGDRFIWTLVN